MAGNSLQPDTRDQSSFIRFKKESFRDVATQADLSAEKMIIDIIRQRDKSPILSEEAGIIGNLNRKGDYWAIDPIDGTVNFIQHIPMFATSVAYIKNGIPVVGAIYNPSQNELFYGAKGIGVYKNNNKISVIDRKPEDALFAVAFSGKKHDSKSRTREFENFKEINDKSMGCLRTGSAALNLAYLAEGRFGGCVGKFNKIWDVAAGLVIAELAGAKIERQFKKNEKNMVSYTASVPLSESFLKNIVIQ